MIFAIIQDMAAQIFHIINMILSRKSLLTFIITVCLAGTMLTNCELSATHRDKVAEAQSDRVLARQDRIQAERDSVTDYQNFKAEAAARVLKNNQIIADFKVRIMTGEKAMKARYQKRLFELEKKNKDLENQLGQYSETGSEKWEIFKSKWEHDMGRLVRSLREITDNNN